MNTSCLSPKAINLRSKEEFRRMFIINHNVEEFLRNKRNDWETGGFHQVYLTQSNLCPEDKCPTK